MTERFALNGLDGRVIFYPPSQRTKGSSRAMSDSANKKANPSSMLPTAECNLCFNPRFSFHTE
jgi:hypothetical protein